MCDPRKHGYGTRMRCLQRPQEGLSPGPDTGLVIQAASLAQVSSEERVTTVATPLHGVGLLLSCPATHHPSLAHTPFPYFPFLPLLACFLPPVLSLPSPPLFSLPLLFFLSLSVVQVGFELMTLLHFPLQ